MDTNKVVMCSFCGNVEGEYCSNTKGPCMIDEDAFAVPQMAIPVPQKTVTNTARAGESANARLTRLMRTPAPDRSVDAEFLAEFEAEVVRQKSLEPAKPTNPKDALAVNKLPLNVVPASMKVYAALAFVEGEAKYGGHNWRVAGVRASVYKAAMERHMEKWWNGEDADPKTGVPHLANIMACAAIILDAKLADKLTDDRPPSVDYASLMDSMEAQVASIRAQFADKNPRHFTIADTGL